MSGDIGAAGCRINVYRGEDGHVYAARWIGGEYDGCDGVDAHELDDAVELVRAEFPGAEVRITGRAQC